MAARSGRRLTFGYTLGKQWKGLSEIADEDTTMADKAMADEDDPDCPWGSRACAASNRIGVPGGEQIPRSRISEIRFFTMLRGSSYEAMFSSSGILMHLMLYTAMVVLYYNYKPLDISVVQASFDPQIISALTFITTFSLSTYLGSVLSRYHERFNNCAKTNGHMTLVSLISGAELPSEPRSAATLMRWANLMMHLYYMMIDGQLNERKWKVLRERGLVTQLEEEELNQLQKKPSAVYVWACRMIHQLYLDGKLSMMHAKGLEEHLSSCRGLAAKQIAYQLTPIPLPLFHLMMLIVNIYIVLMGWNSAVRLVGDILVEGGLAEGDEEESWRIDAWWALLTEAVAYLFVVIFYNVMLRIAEGMSNPYGNETTDYSIDFDLINLWEESKETIANMRTQGSKDGSATGDLAARMIDAANSVENPMLSSAPAETQTTLAALREA